MTKSKGPQGSLGALFRAENWQERQDSNPRPLVLESDATSVVLCFQALI